MSDDINLDAYRPCVGVMLINQHGKVWMGLRADAPGDAEGPGDWWQMPQGGIDEGEDKLSGLIRELKEETGAQNIQNIEAFGLYEEYRPWYKDDFEIMHMESFCYVCSIDEQQLAPSGGRGHHI